jgi:hypothetical protein
MGWEEWEWVQENGDVGDRAAEVLFNCNFFSFARRSCTGHWPLLLFTRSHWPVAASPSIAG